MRKSYSISVVVVSMLVACICLPSCLPEIEKEGLAETKPDDVVADIVVDRTPPYRNISPEEIHSNPAYWNMAWVGREGELIKIVKDIPKQYHESHVYIRGETDCNDMAIDIWNMLCARGVTSIIAIGNFNKEKATFLECRHAWLVVCYRSGPLFAIEPTSGEAYLLLPETCPEPKRRQYERGFFYAKPSDLRADLGERW